MSSDVNTRTAGSGVRSFTRQCQPRNKQAPGKETADTNVHNHGTFVNKRTTQHSVYAGRIHSRALCTAECVRASALSMRIVTHEEQRPLKKVMGTQAQEADFTAFHTLGELRWEERHREQNQYFLSPASK